RGTATRSVFDPPVIGRYPPVSCLRENKPPGRVAGGDLSLSFVSEKVDAARLLISEKHADPAPLLRSMIKFETMSSQILTRASRYFVRPSETVPSLAPATGATVEPITQTARGVPDGVPRIVFSACGR